MSLAILYILHLNIAWIETNNLQPVLKRRIALLKSMGRIPDAIKALTSFLDASPTDAEAWAEIGDLYLGEGLYQQAIFALEEVMLITPNAWNVRQGCALHRPQDNP